MKIDDDKTVMSTKITINVTLKQQDDKQCSHCKRTKPLVDFAGATGKIMTRCRTCCNFCEHNRPKNQCRECGGASICQHNRYKSTCKDCGGASICEHNRRKNYCKECNGSYICQHNRQKSTCKLCMDNPIPFIIRRMISSSKQHDKESNRYTGVNYIDEEFLQSLFDIITECVHCGIPFSYRECCPSLVTIERINNDEEHHVENCTLCCYQCNMQQYT